MAGDRISWLVPSAKRTVKGTPFRRGMFSWNRGAGTAHLFVAQGARRVAEPTADDLEEQELVYMSRAEIELALAGGQFKVLAWTTAVALALLWMS